MSTNNVPFGPNNQNHYTFPPKINFSELEIKLIKEMQDASHRNFIRIPFDYTYRGPMGPMEGRMDYNGGVPPLPPAPVPPAPKSQKVDQKISNQSPKTVIKEALIVGGAFAGKRMKLDRFLSDLHFPLPNEEKEVYKLESITLNEEGTIETGVYTHNLLAQNSHRCQVSAATLAELVKGYLKSKVDLEFESLQKMLCEVEDDLSELPQGEEPKERKPKLFDLKKSPNGNLSVEFKVEFDPDVFGHSFFGAMKGKTS